MMHKFKVSAGQVGGLKLRDYQQKAVAEICAHLAEGTPTLLVAPTGAGKTLIAAKIAEPYSRVLFIAHRRELIDQARKVFGRKIYAASAVTALRYGPKAVDLLILDEAHRAAAPINRKIIERYSNVPRFGMTATPLRTDGQGLCDIFDALVEASTVSELVSQGYLVPYRAFEAPDEALGQLAHMKRTAGDYATSELSALMNQPRLVGDVVREYVKHAPGRPAVVFAVSVVHSKSLVDAFRKADVRAAHLDGHATELRRKAALADLAAGRIDVLCNVNLFTEGWDCPPVSCVVMARPTCSKGLYLQCVGRGMRLHSGKSDLIILDHAGNMQRHGYPDEKQEWSLESDRQRAKREAEIAELERLHSLGFESVEAELEEKRKIRGGCYTSSQVLQLFPEIQKKSLPSYLRNRGVESLSGKQGPSTIYRKSDIDELVSCEGRCYRTLEAASVLGVSATKISRFLNRRGVHPHGSLKNVGTRYLKVEIDRIRSQMDACYTAQEAMAALGGISFAAFKKACKSHGVADRAFGRQDQYLKTEIHRLAELRGRTGYTLHEVMTLVKSHGGPALKSGSAYLLIKRHGISPIDGMAGTATKYPTEPVDMLLKKLVDTMTIREAASLAGLGGCRFGQVLREVGIQPITPSFGREARYLKVDISRVLEMRSIG